MTDASVAWFHAVCPFEIVPVRCFEDHQSRLGWDIPVREVPAAIEPVELRVGKRGERTAGLTWEADAISAAPTDHQRILDRARRHPCCVSP